MRPDLVEIQFGLGQQVGRQHRPGIGVFGENQTLPHGRMGGDRRLDLPEFDAESADLDLLIGPADELQLRGQIAPHQITGTEHPHAGVERVGDESLRGHRRPPQVSTRQLKPAKVQFAGHLGGHGL